MKDDRTATLRVFAVISVLSLLAYLGFSLPVRAFLAEAHTLLGKLVEVVP